MSSDAEQTKGPSTRDAGFENEIPEIGPEVVAADALNGSRSPVSRHVFSADDSHVRDLLSADIDCVICCRLMIDPVTVSCGHSFCTPCLQRALDFSCVCPSCRNVLHYDDLLSLPVSTVLRNMIETLFPAEYSVRRKELDADIESSATNLFRRMPLFVLDVVVFPGQKSTYCIFEPRYRLMLRRVMQGSRRFGLVSIRRVGDSGLDISDVGCVLEVTNCHRLADGRSLINTIGRERFRILDREELDGYLVARTEKLEDVETDSNDASPTTMHIRNFLKQTVENRGQWAQPAVMRALSENGGIPDENASPTEFGMWLAKALIAENEDRQRLLEETDPVERIMAIARTLQRANQVTWPPDFGETKCTMQ